MRGLDLRTRFDGVLAWNSTFHLTPADQRGMFKVLRRHCRPGAVLMFTAGHRHGDALGTFEGDTLYHGSLDPSECRRRLNRHGFDVIDHVMQDPECGRHTVWPARRRI